MTAFSPPWLLRSPHVQTLGAALPLHLGVPLGVRAQALRVPIDGGALHASAGWQHGARPAVILVHGVGGSIDSHYVVRAARAFHGAGFHVVRLNQRGAGSSLGHVPSLYHAGLTADLRAAARFVGAMDGVQSVALVGFSLGGNCALKLAAEPDASSCLRAVVSISAPLDLAATCRLLNRPLRRPYERYVLRALLAQARAFAAHHPARPGFDVARLARVKSLWDYDDAVVAPMHGLGTAAQYYAQMSAGPALPNIGVPTLLVHASDDPMVPGSTVEPFLPRRSRAVELAWSARGGHVGWFGGLAPSDWTRTWAVDRALEFLARSG